MIVDVSSRSPVCDVQDRLKLYLAATLPNLVAALFLLPFIIS
jgi:hypothetical protein